MQPATLLRLAHVFPFEFGSARHWLRRRLTASGAWPVRIQVHGRELELHGDNNGEWKFALSPYVYNRSELRFLERAMPPVGGVFVDVGANVGVYAFVMAARRGAEATVLAIEPNPQMIARLRRNMFELNDFGSVGCRVLVENCAVGASFGYGFLDVSQGLHMARVVDVGGTVRTPLRPLLDIVTRHGLQRIDALKIDVEGYEDRALLPFFAEAPADLRPGAMVIEINRRHEWAEDVITPLRAVGYRQVARNRSNLLLRLAPEPPSTRAACR